MTFLEQQRPQARQVKENGVSRSRLKSREGILSCFNVSASGRSRGISAACVEFEQGLNEPTRLVLLDLDDPLHVGLENLKDLRGQFRGMEQSLSRIPLEPGLGPSFPGVRIRPLLNESLRGVLPAPDVPVEEAERGAEGRGRPGELQEIPPAEVVGVLRIVHGPIVPSPTQVVKTDFLSAGRRPSLPRFDSPSPVA